ncbi:ribonuclease HII [bacterium]|nr:ribonuclease HII [bacterium]
METFSRIEEKLSSQKIVIAGVDEAGRGPLAGPVVSAAVVWDYSILNPGIKDSKKLSEKRREILFDYIRENAASIGVAIVSPEEIDRLNIRNASLLAMRKAVERLSIPPEVVLVDGRDAIPALPIKQHPIISGDDKILAISAASIVAKVIRDRIMLRYDKEYPGYGFANHKGYPTKEHKEAIRRLGPSPIHRKTFHAVASFIL